MTQVGYEETNKIKNIINNSDKDIFLVGKRGYGKTTVLKGLNNYCTDDKMVIDGSLKIGELLFLVDNDVFNLYYICLMLKRILLSISMKYSFQMNFFEEFEEKLNKIMTQIGYMNMTGIHKKTTNLISEDLYNRPEILIDEFLRLSSKYLKLEDIVLIIDNFDVVGESSKRYQRFIYDRIREYFRLIMTISADNAVDNDQLLEDFSIDHELVKITYSTSLDSVKEILSGEVKEYYLRNKKHSLILPLNLVISDETIILMIKKTNGNLFDMLHALRHLYNHINELSALEYDKFILNYIDKEINKNPIISGIIIPKRTLYIEPNNK